MQNFGVLFGWGVGSAASIALPLPLHPKVPHSKIHMLALNIYNTSTLTDRNVARRVRRDRAIEISKQIYLKNQFPRYLLEQKIKEVRNRDFRPSNRKEKLKEDMENPDFEHHSFTLPYTSFRCSTVASNIYKIMETYTPFFKLHLI